MQRELLIVSHYPSQKTPFHLQIHLILFANCLIVQHFEALRLFEGLCAVEVKCV